MRAVWGDAIPALRGIVAVVHSYNMPMMLVSSGLVAVAFGSQDATWGDFLAWKGRRLLVPLLIWAPLFYVLQALRHGQGTEITVLALLKAVLLPYSIFWYLHALFYASTLQRALAQAGLGTALRVGVSAVLFAASFGLPESPLESAGGMLRFVCFWNFFYAIGTGLMPALRRVPDVRIPPLAHVGERSLCIYLFHIHFLNLARIVTLRFFPQEVWVNVATGTVVAVLGPVVLYRILGKNRWFRLSIGEKPLRSELVARA